MYLDLDHTTTCNSSVYLTQHLVGSSSDCVYIFLHTGKKYYSRSIRHAYLPACLQVEGTAPASAKEECGFGCWLSLWPVSYSLKGSISNKKPQRKTWKYFHSGWVVVQNTTIAFMKQQPNYTSFSSLWSVLNIKAFGTVNIVKPLRRRKASMRKQLLSTE